MKRHHLTPIAGGLCALLLSLTVPCAHAGDAEKKYETGPAALNKIGKELHQALDAKKRALLRVQPVYVETMTTPCINPSVCHENGAASAAVQVSAGFVDLINYLAHAKAIDGTDRGFLRKYIVSLAQEAGDKPLPDVQTLAGTKGWDFDTLNHQVSNFNQMVGALVAIDMAHHYLGHYQKYAARLADSQGLPVPINTLLTPGEWRDAVVAGSRNALSCGLGVDGLNLLYETIDKMPARPAWTAYFLPEKINVAKIKKELVKIEKDFFLAGN